MVLLDINKFMAELQGFANSAKLKGSFTVTFKKFDGHNKPKPREGRPPLKEPDEYMCLIRAQFKSKKISTLVKPEDVRLVTRLFSPFMKSKMDGLKRIKKVKSKTKAAKG